MPHPILPLKLHIPSLRKGFIPRPQLIAQLDEVWQPDKRLALVCAPAGYGKTSLIASYILHLQEGKGVFLVCPAFAWLSLDQADNNLPRFLLYLIEALKKFLTHQQYLDCQEAIKLLEGSQQVPPLDILTVLLNGLSESPTPLIFVMDDYHCITKTTVNEIVQFLLVNMPSHMRFLLATRVDPRLKLSQLRAHNQMVEIRTGELQFTLAESSDFLNRTFNLSLTKEQIALLANRTEGWAVGLQMAALSLQGRDNPQGFIQAFSGSHHLILEYLMDEVLNRQPPDFQEFLLRTSILERLCGESCDYLLDQPKTSQAMLESLERMNLFLVPLDDENRWYRYHHLFASLLRSRLRQALDAVLIKELYRRASQWYESQGLLADAIAQALAAPDPTYAADLLEREILPFFYLSEIMQVHQWLELLPKSVILQRPLLCAVYAASISLLPPYSPKSVWAAEEWMQVAEQALATEFPNRIISQAFIFTMRSFWARWLSESPEIIFQLITKALSVLPSDPGIKLSREQLYVRSALQTNLAMTYWAAGDEEAARQAFLDARRINSASNDLFNASGSINYLAKIHVLHGQLMEAAMLCQEALTFFDSHQTHLGHRVPFSAEIGIQMAEILIEQNKLAEGEQLVKESFELAKWTMGENILFRGNLILARSAAFRRDSTAAFKYLDEAEKIYTGGASLVCAQRASLWLALSDKHPEYLDLAKQWGQAQTLVEFQKGLPQVEWTISLVLARLILVDQDSLLAGNGETSDPQIISLLEWLERQEMAAQSHDWAHWEIQLRLIECMARRSIGDNPGALAALHHALELASPGGYILVFLEEGELLRKLLSCLSKEAGGLSLYLNKLQAAFTDRSDQLVHPSGSGEGLIEPLTGREMEVLLLICQGFSNQEIAEKLVITISTVKKHNYSIFGKLGITNRTQAVVRAKQIGLCN
jgi:LuxR family maltose regulon positive regulatory protein